MRVSVLSDLHLSVHGPACTTTPSVDALCAAVDYLARRSDRVVLAGDVFDHDVGRNPFARFAELQRIARAWAPALDRLERVGALAIWGNHDPLASRLGAAEVVDLVARGARLRVLHGHQFVREGAAIRAAKVGVKWIAGLDDRHGAGRLSKVLYRTNGALGQSVRARIERSALDYLAEHREIDVLVCGHTHEPRVVTTERGAIYANSGAASFGRFDALLVDLETLNVEIVDLSDIV